MKKSKVVYRTVTKRRRIKKKKKNADALTWPELLRNTPVKDLVGKNFRLKEIQANQTIKDALKLMTEFDLLSLPVRAVDDDAAAHVAAISEAAAAAAAKLEQKQQEREKRRKEKRAQLDSSGSPRKTVKIVDKDEEHDHDASSTSHPHSRRKSFAAHEYIGFVDMIDLVVGMSAIDTGATALAEALSNNEIDWTEFMSRENDVFLNQPIGDVCNTSERNPWRTLPLHASVHHLLSLFASSPDIHRVALVDDNGEVFGIISQSRVIQFIAEHLDRFPQPLERLVESDVWGARVVTVPAATATAKDAFQKMADEKVSAVAVVGDSGRIVGVLSASDLKRSSGGFNPFADMHLNVMQYLTLRSGSGASHKAGDGESKSLTPITVQVKEKMKNILNLLVSNRIHRVFVVDAEHKPIAVLALYDLIVFLQTIGEFEITKDNTVVH